MMRRLLLWGILAAASACAASSSSRYGEPVYTGRAEFPTSLFESMYYVPSRPTAEPRPAVPRLSGGWYPDELNHPTKLPKSALPSEQVLPKPLPQREKLQALVHDLSLIHI